MYIYTYTHKPTYTYVSACVLSHFSCVWLCYPMECDPTGSSVHGILQVRILEWVAMPFLHGIFPTTKVSNLCFLCLLHWQVDSLPLGSPGKQISNDVPFRTIRRDNLGKCDFLPCWWCCSCWQIRWLLLHLWLFTWSSSWSLQLHKDTPSPNM